MTISAYHVLSKKVENRIFTHNQDMYEYGHFGSKFPDCHIKIYRSLKRRAILKILEE